MSEFRRMRQKAGPMGLRGLLPATRKRTRVDASMTRTDDNLTFVVNPRTRGLCAGEVGSMQIIDSQLGRLVGIEPTTS